MHDYHLASKFSATALAKGLESGALTPWRVDGQGQLWLQRRLPPVVSLEGDSLPEINGVPASASAPTDYLPEEQLGQAVTRAELRGEQLVPWRKDCHGRQWFRTVPRRPAK